MEILFPDEAAPDERTRLALEAMLGMLGENDVNVSKIQKFPLILAWPNSKFRYVGRLILTKGKNRKPIALAREVYGQHIVNMLYDGAVRRVSDQITWLSEQAAQLNPDKTFKAVLMLAPNRGDLQIATSGKKYIDIEYVVNSNDNGYFELVGVSDYIQSLSQYEQERLARIADIQASNTDFDGLPA